VFICGVSAAPLAAAPTSPQAGAPSAEAEGWLRQNDGENLLRYLLADGVFSKLQSAQLALGVDRTCELVTPSFERAVKDLHPRWTKIYRRVAARFPYARGNQRREAQLLFAVGLETLDLLQPKVEAITEPVQVESLKIDSDAIDYEVAFARIAEARADGRASCGLRGRVPPTPGPAQQKNGVN
jgi:hypothetical protein